MKLNLFRPIIQGKVGNKEAYFLLDTGSSKPLIDSSLIETYNLELGDKFLGTLTGTGGTISDVYYCKNNVILNNKTLDKFILVDLSSIRNSIERETGINILGVISYPLMQSLGLIIDLVNNKVNGI